MLRALKRLLAGGSCNDPAQLALPLTTNDADELTPLGMDSISAADAMLGRLRALGMRRIDRCRLTSNRNVMVSFSRGEIRIHEGYLDAPPEVLRAIVVFVQGRTRAVRRAAQRTIVSHPVTCVPVADRRPRTRREDEPLAADLAAWYEAYNEQHFGGRLKTVNIRVSRRMRSRLGHYTCATHGEPAEIAISWRHWRRHGWHEALHTLLHEMVHQWQDETGQAIDHSASFRAKAREIGIAPYARRHLHARGKRSYQISALSYQE